MLIVDCMIKVTHAHVANVYELFIFSFESFLFWLKFYAWRGWLFLIFFISIESQAVSMYHVVCKVSTTMVHLMLCSLYKVCVCTMNILHIYIYIYSMWWYMYYVMCLYHADVCVHVWCIFFFKIIYYIIWVPIYICGKTTAELQIWHWCQHTCSVTVDIKMKLPWSWSYSSRR